MHTKATVALWCETDRMAESNSDSPLQDSENTSGDNAQNKECAVTSSDGDQLQVWHLFAL